MAGATQGKSTASATGGFDSVQMQELLSAMGSKPKEQKANVLQRILGPIIGIGSLPDVIYGAMKNEFGGDVGKAGLHYLTNIGKGFETTFTGKKPEEIKTTADILKDFGVIPGKDIGSKAARFVLGLAGDIVLDPTTYISFGAAGLGKKAATEAVEGVTKQIAKKGGQELGEAATRELTEVLAKKGVRSLGETLVKYGADDITKGLFSSAVKNLPAKQALKIFGKEITQVPAIVKGVKGLVNPIGTLGEVGWGVAKKAMPEVTEGISKGAARLFSAKGFAKMTGNEELYDQLRKAGNDIGMSDRMVELEWLAPLKKLQGERDDVVKAVQGVMEGTTALESLSKEVAEKAGKYKSLFAPELKNIFTALTERGILQKPEQVFVKNITALTNEQLANKELKPLIDESLNTIGTAPGVYSAAKSVGITLDNTGRTTAKQLRAMIDDKNVREALIGSVRTLAQQKGISNKVLDEWINNMQVVGAALDSGLRAAKPAVTENLLKYIPAPTEQGAAVADEAFLKQLAASGKLGIGEELMKPAGVLSDPRWKELYGAAENITSGAKGWIPHGKAMGFTEEFIRNRFDSDVAEQIMSEPKILKEIGKVAEGKPAGFIKAETLTELLSKSKYKGISRTGLASAEKYLGEFGMPRTYKTLAEGMKEGVVYDQNFARVLGDYISSAKKAITAYDSFEVLKKLNSEAGGKLLPSIKEDLAGKLPVGSVDIGEALGIKQLKGFAADKDAMEVFKSAGRFVGDQGTSDLLKLYDKALKPWKQFVTGLGPGAVGYNVRNAIGDLQNMILGGFRNRANAMDRAYKALAYENYAKNMGKEAALAKYGQGAANDLQKVFNSGLLRGEQITEEMGERVSGLESKLGITTSKAKKVVSQVADKLTSPGRFREEWFRAANMLDALDRTKGNVVDAAKLAAKSSLDYSNLTSFERNVMRRVIPFYSFFRQNMEFQLETFAKRPGAFVAQQKIINNLRKTLSVDTMSEEDWAAMPEWMKTGVSIAVGKKGSKVDILSGFGDPFSSITNFIGSTPKETLQKVASGSSPLLKMLVEQTTGQNLYQQEPISAGYRGDAYKDSPPFIKEFLDYKEVPRVTSDGKKYVEYRVDPVASYWLNNLPFVGTTNTLIKRLMETFGREGSLKYLTNLVSGARIYPRDVESEQRARERELQQLLQQQLMQEGIGSEYSNFYIPKTQKAALQQQYGINI